jgi:hypothetical protein
MMYHTKRVNKFTPKMFYWIGLSCGPYDLPPIFLNYDS